MGGWKKLLSLDHLSASSSICVPRGRIVPALGVFLAASLLLFYLLGPIYGGNAAASFGTSWGGVSSLFSSISGYSGLLGGTGNASVAAGHPSSGAAEAHIVEEKGGVVTENSTAEDRKRGGPMIAEAPAAANGTVSSSGGGREEGEENPVFAQGQGKETVLEDADKYAAAPSPGWNDESAWSSSSSSSSAAVVHEISPALAPAAAHSLMPGNATSLAKGGDVSGSRIIQGEAAAAAASPSPKNKKCDIFDGRWVRDDAGPYYPPGSCPHIDVYFDCHKNGRPDDDYLKWRWQPHGCNLPRLNATKFLELLRGKRLIFVGDSLNRNMWESLVCILRHAIADKKRVYEKSGRSQFKGRGFYSFIFKDYSCSIDYVRSTFLVREVFFKGSHAPEGDRLRLDVMDDTTSAYREADIVVFNTGHWWTHEKTSEGKDYYQEGNHVYPVLNVMDAFKKALSTWARWVDKNINARKTRVIFRGYSLTHFSGGQWNSGGQCHKETEPIFNDAYLVKYPKKMRAVEDILAKMKMPVTYLNISRLTDYRKDGHPSIYRETYSSTADPKAAEATQDCSHWCLPGIPDTWNELLYASLVMDDKISL